MARVCSKELKSINSLELQKESRSNQMYTEIIDLFIDK